MFKTVQDNVWAFDAEWAPDPHAGRLLYGLSSEMSDREVVEAMWREGGATQEEPQPFLKTMVCRIVSISAVVRRVNSKDSDDISLHLRSLPGDVRDSEQCQERSVVSAFLNAVGNHRPQLVGFSSISADLKILIQRGIALGLQASKFCRRPNKPWEGVDYFDRHSSWHVDLREVMAGWGKQSHSLHEAAVLSGIPGKMEMDGQQVVTLWLEGALDKIVAYNEFDALTTYLLWLRVAYFGGFFTKEAYLREQLRVRDFLETDDRPHLKRYLLEWDRLQQAIALR